GSSPSSMKMRAGFWLGFTPYLSSISRAMVSLPFKPHSHGARRGNGSRMLLFVGVDDARADFASAQVDGARPQRDAVFPVKGVPHRLGQAVYAALGQAHA